MCYVLYHGYYKRGECPGVENTPAGMYGRTGTHPVGIGQRAQPPVPHEIPSKRRHEANDDIRESKRLGLVRQITDISCSVSNLEAKTANVLEDSMSLRVWARYSRMDDSPVRHTPSSPCP